MSKGHYIDQLSAYVDQELSKEDRQTVAEHLMQCDSCRREHDRIKVGAGLAGKLARADASETVWRNIDADLNGERTPSLEAFARPRTFDLRHIGAFATALVLVGLLSFLVYRGLFAGGDVETVAIQPEQISAANAANSTTAVVPSVNANVVNASSQTTNSNANSNSVPTSDAGTWQVETIAGNASASKIAVGEYLETDAASRVRIDVADIGNVELAPNSRVKLVGTTDKQHRLSLERGKLHARIAAPPRLFIVDTPSAVAVDLGCEYILDVDKAGNSKLVVTSGFVALERGGRESIVPAGAACLTQKGKGLGTPFSSESTPEFEKALYSFDFAGGGSRAVKEIVSRADLYDIVTLWHLLSRVSKDDRPTVYDTLARFVPPPAGVSRDSVLALHKPTLERWRQAVETVWFD